MWKENSSYRKWCMKLYLPNVIWNFIYQMNSYPPKMLYERVSSENAMWHLNHMKCYIRNVLHHIFIHRHVIWKLINYFFIWNLFYRICNIKFYPTVIYNSPNMLYDIVSTVNVKWNVILNRCYMEFDLPKMLIKCSSR